MFRLTRPALAFLSLFAMSLAACKTIYSDVYSPRRNYFKPVQEKTKPADLLPLLPPSTPGPAVDLAPPGLPDAPAPPPEMTPPPAPPAEPAAPAIPGL